MNKLILLFLLISFMSQAQSSITGVVYDIETDSVIPYTTIGLIQNGKIVKGVESDTSGLCIIDTIKAGKYKLKAMSIGYKSKKVKCKVFDQSIMSVDLGIEEDPTAYELGCFPDYGTFLIDFQSMSSGKSFLSKEISKIPITK